MSHRYQTEDDVEKIPDGLALAMAYDRAREDAGLREWMRPAFAGEWPVPVLVPDGFELHTLVRVVGPRLRARFPVVAPADDRRAS